LREIAKIAGIAKPLKLEKDFAADCADGRRSNQTAAFTE
jgi:hypothetical protein